MDIPSLFMIPSSVSSGKVHSVFPNSTDADFDFNRDSDATRVNSEGLIERVGYYGSELVVNGNFATDIIIQCFFLFFTSFFAAVFHPFFFQL